MNFLFFFCDNVSDEAAMAQCYDNLKLSLLIYGIKNKIGFVSQWISSMRFDDFECAA